MANNSDIQRIKEWISEKTEGHQGTYIIGTYLVLFLIGVLLITLTPGKMSLFECVILAVLWPIEIVCGLFFLAAFIYFIYKVICVLLKR